LTVLVSQHRDGELITQVLRHLKFQSIRGSTTRGGVAALRGIMRGGERERGRRTRGQHPSPPPLPRSPPRRLSHLDSRWPARSAPPSGRGCDLLGFPAANADRVHGFWI
jgi:hypothetical protein